MPNLVQSVEQLGAPPEEAQSLAWRQNLILRWRRDPRGFQVLAGACEPESRY